MKAQRIINATKEILKTLTGLKVVLEPCPIITSEPHVRVQFLGSESAGCKALCLKFQLSLIGAGDGPEVFVEKVMDASSVLTRLYSPDEKRYLDFSLDNTVIRMSFVEGLTPSASFIQNEYKETENREWMYYFNEIRYFTLTYKYGETHES